jgi:hypothetical protein
MFGPLLTDDVLVASLAKVHFSRPDPDPGKPGLEAALRPELLEVL